MFSEKTKSELARILPDKECCRLSELSALMRTGASVQIGNSGRSISFRTEVATVARMIYNLLRQSFGIQCQITIIRQNRLKKHLVYIVRTAPQTDIMAIMTSLGALTHPGTDPGAQGDIASHELPKSKHLRPCCTTAYLRGTFLGCGSVMSPEKGYHLELVLDDEENAEYVVRLAGQLGIHLRTSSRKRKIVCYLKDADEISNALALMGAHSSLLDLESIRVVREMRNGVNRLVNCETANVDKVVSASMKQGGAIGFLLAKLGFDALPDTLTEVARMRIKYPDVSLRELGALMSPPVGKSGVNHRMRRLMEMACERGYRPNGGEDSYPGG